MDSFTKLGGKGKEEEVKMLKSRYVIIRTNENIFFEQEIKFW